MPDGIANEHPGNSSPNFSHGVGNGPTLPVAINTTVNLTANLDGSSYGTQVVVDAALLKIALGTTSAFGATFVIGTITLEIPAPVGGLTGNLSSVNGQLPTSKWTVAAGQTTCTFQVATNDVAATGQMSVTATLGPQSLTASTAV